MTTPSPKPKRRWFQFSLRTLLVFVLLVSIGLSWFGVKMQKARRQKEAVKAIEKAGGEVLYDYGLGAPFADEPSVPKWARALLGDDFFLDVVGVWGNLRDFGDDKATYLKRLTGLETLSLTNTQITDAAFRHLEGLTNLEDLDLSGTQVTDAALEHLEGLANLNGLGLYGTAITDAGLEHLEGLTNLEDLYLGCTQVTDAGLEHLEGLTELKWLYLGGTSITDAGLENLERLTKLKWLDLSDTQVAPEGVKMLQEAPTFRTSRCGFPRISWRQVSGRSASAAGRAA
jgi:Leucine-rich repeat (LRR) protein